MCWHIYIFIFFPFGDNCIEGLQRAKGMESRRKWQIHCLSLRDSGRLFLNVTVTLKVCPRSARVAAPKQERRRLIAASNAHTHTNASKQASKQAHVISIRHLDCSKSLQEHWLHIGGCLWKSWRRAQARQDVNSDVRANPGAEYVFLFNTKLALFLRPFLQACRHSLASVCFIPKD